MGFFNMIANSIKRGGTRLRNALMQPFIVFARKVRRFVHPDSIVNKVVGDVKKTVKGITKAKPVSLKDYYSFGKYYVLKRLVYVIIAFIILLPLLYIRFLHPVVVSTFFAKTIPINSEEQYGYTGKVRLVDEATGVLLFRGRLEDGRITGDGTLFDYEGNLRYDGEFLLEMYSGLGELYYSNGKLKYRGNFEMNQYSGNGILYYDSGTLCYEGDFVKGLYEGSGKLYFTDGTLQYEGAFVQGKYN